MRNAHGIGRLSGMIVASVMLAGVAGCESRPDKVLSDSEMESLLTDLILADAYGQSADGRALPDSVRRHLGESVMKAHGVDYATLDSTYAWYARNLDQYYRVYTKVQTRVDNQRRKVAGDTGEADKGFENNIWQLPGHMLFSPLAESDALVFQLDGNSIGKGDRLEWKMRLSNGNETDMLLGVDYDDGTTLIVRRTFYGDKRLSLALASDTARTPRRIYGVMSVPRNVMPVYADSILLLKEPFDSTVYADAWSQRLFYGPRPKPKPKQENPDTIAADSMSGNN